MAGSYHDFTTTEGKTVYAPTFYLKNSKGKYLSIVATNANSGYELKLTDSPQTEFSYNTLGELNTAKSTGLKIIIENGQYVLVDGRQSGTDPENIKIFVQSTNTIGSAYTITNTILPTITLEKVEAGTTTALPDVVFEMYQKDDNNVITTYYSFDDAKNEIDWSASSKIMTTDSSGTITYKYLPDGTYYLKETKTADGYNLLTEELWFKVSGGKVTDVSNSSYISVSTDGLTITVQNNPGVELPETGGISLPVTYAVGLILILASAGLLILRRNKKSTHE